MKATGFYEKRKEIITLKEEGIPVGAGKLTYPWLYTIGYWFYLQIESPQSLVFVVRVSTFLMALPAIVCETMLVWPSPRV